MNANTFKVVAAIAVAVLSIGVVVANFAVPVSAQGNMTNATAPNATNATMSNATSGGGAQGSSGGMSSGGGG